MRITRTLSVLAFLSLSACSGTEVAKITGPRFVAVGAKGTVLEATDGTAWNVVDAGAAVNFTSIVYAANMFVAVGEGGVVFTSENGIEFKQRYSPTGVDLGHVIHTGERFVAVGGDFDVGAVTITSKDGLAWENMLSPGSFMFHAVAHKNDLLIAAAYARSDLQTPALFTSAPGQPWEESIGPDFWDSVTTTDGVFTVGGSSVHHFVDGIGWTSQTISAGISSRAITHAANTFVVAGEMGGLYSSPDGKAFTAHSLPNETRYFQGVTHNGTDTFVAVGSGGMIATSKDGASWSTVTTETTQSLNDVAYGGVP